MMRQGSKDAKMPSKNRALLITPLSLVTYHFLFIIKGLLDPGCLNHSRDCVPILFNHRSFQSPAVCLGFSRFSRKTRIPGKNGIGRYSYHGSLLDPGDRRGGKQGVGLRPGPGGGERSVGTDEGSPNLADRGCRIRHGQGYGHGLFKESTSKSQPQ